MTEPTSPSPHGPTAPSPHGSRSSAPLVHIAVIIATGVLLLVGTFGLYLWSQRPQVTRVDVRDVVYSTIQRETPEAFLITGALEVTATTRVENTRTLLPGVLGIDLGTTSATVRVPGRISYGFDARQLTPEMINVMGDTIEVVVPEPVLYSVEPNLEQMEVETRRGWLRLSRSTVDQVRGRAIELVQQTMRAQGAAHLEGSVQPRINTADALYQMLRPVLIAAGIEDPLIRFRIGDLQLQRRE